MLFAPWSRRAALSLLLLVLPLSPAFADPASDAWLEPSGRPSVQARQALTLLADAASHGLEPQDYDLTALQQALRLADEQPGHGPALAAALDSAMQRYLRELHLGRVDPRRLGQDFEPPTHRGEAAFDAAARLREALAAQRLPEAVREAAPQLPLYEQLRAALAQLRALGEHPVGWEQPLPPLPRVPKSRAPAKLEPGHDWAGVPLLAQRLLALGDLPSLPPAPLRYEGQLVAALMRFQQRHGLEPDGVIGRATVAALELTPAQRARQVELNLERLRWTPLMQAARMVTINIPEFTLRAYEQSENGRIVVRETMKVIVGKAMDTQTPVFDEAMRFIEFSPFWNVPPSIARKETVPTLRRDPGYLAREEMEFVRADGRISTEVSAAALDEVLAGRARIRQRPGAKNALGGIKFVFPNRDNIYLHHTPAVELFSRSRRDFSHGCIRVEQPLRLAMFVLKSMPEWTEARVQAAMDSGHLQTLKLAEPIPVLIAYGTALVTEGRLHFYPDLYGHDRRLDEALLQRHRQRAR